MSHPRYYILGYILVRIRWHGHACFEIVDRESNIVIDPHDGASIGLKKPTARTKLVLISHEHFDHNAYSMVLDKDGEYVSMRTGEFKLGPFKVRGVMTFHDKENGRRRGRNVVYRITTPSGITILHAGDLGHVLTEDQARELKPVDIALLPVGGTFTIDHEEAFKVFEEVEGRIFIPMHYWISGVNLPLDTIDKTLRYAESKGFKINEIRSSHIDLEPDEIHKYSRTLIVFKEYG